MKHFFTGLLIAVTYFLILLKTLPDYGMNEDSPGKFLRGQTYLQFLTTGRDRFDQPDLPSPVLFYPGQRISLTRLNTYEDHDVPQTPIQPIPDGKTRQEFFTQYLKEHERQSFYKNNAFGLSYLSAQDLGQPPMSDILMAVSNRIFYEKLGILGDIEAYHVYSIFLASLVLFVVFYFTSSIWGFLTAIIATLTLAAYPIFFSESHFNVKDIPELAFISVSIIAFYFWVIRRKFRWYIILLFTSTVGFGTKFNILFLLLILTPWVYAIRHSQSFHSWWSKRTKLLLVLLATLPPVLIFLLWPYLWPSPILRSIDIVKFYWDDAGLGINKSTPYYYFGLPFFYFFRYFDARWLLLVVSMTPTTTLVLVCIGLLRTLFNRHKFHYVHLLILLWLTVPIAKNIVFRIGIYHSIRQYIELLPALAILSGIGGFTLIQSFTYVVSKGSTFQKNTQNVSIFSALFSLILIASYAFHLVSILVRSHPNQNVYFNSLFGGFAGAQQYLQFDWNVSYDNPYRQAVTWLNTYAEPDAKLAFADGTMMGISPLWLRPDIDFGSHFSHIDQNGEYIITLERYRLPDEFLFRYLERFLEPVHTISIDGIPIANIWRNDPAYVKQGMNEMKEIANNTQVRDQTTSRPNWSVDFGKKMKLVSITVNVPATGCELHNTHSHQEDILRFSLSNGTFIPMRVKRNQTTYELLFPAEETDTISFDETIPSSCFFQGKITKIQVLKEN